MEIEGSVAVVTGGASGLGESTTRALVSAGARVAILDLPISAGEKVAAEIGSDVIFCPCDVTQPDQIEAAVAKTVQSFGAVRIGTPASGH